MNSKDQQNVPHRRGVLRRSCRVSYGTPSDSIQAAPQAADNDVEIIVSIVDHQPDPSYTKGLTAIADALVVQMFDSGVGETLRMAYTMIQQHQERTNRRTQRSMAAEALREHLARLDETLDDL